MVERFLGVEEAVGSSPVVPTTFFYKILATQAYDAKIVLLGKAQGSLAFM